MTLRYCILGRSARDRRSRSRSTSWERRRRERKKTRVSNWDIRPEQMTPEMIALAAVLPSVGNMPHVMGASSLAILGGQAMTSLLPASQSMQATR
jgi:hypothetical protein